MKKAHIFFSLAISFSTDLPKFHNFSLQEVADAG